MKPALQEKDFADAHDIFVVDRAGGDEASRESNFQSVDLLGTSYPEPYEMDKELLNKAVVGPKFEIKHQSLTQLLCQNALARHNKAEREKTRVWTGLISQLQSSPKSTRGILSISK
ncbi:hypothetical protein B9Z55_029045 [Caenorhabditis nigoni]|nr:hypothetical protein B9Z55_029045 [Caenorhabditis nigoni]